MAMSDTVYGVYTEGQERFDPPSFGNFSTPGQMQKPLVIN